MPNNKRPVSLFKGQNKGVNSPKSGIQNVGSEEKYWGCFFCFIVFCIFAL